MPLSFLPFPEDPQLDNPDLFSANQAVAPYVFYEMRSEYVWDENLLQLPVAYETASTQDAAGPGYTLPLFQRQAAEMVQSAAPSGYRIVTWELARMNAVPYMPDPTPSDSNEVVDRVKITTEAPLLQPDGLSYLYYARGEYRYALKQPPWATTDALRSASNDATVDPADNFATDPQQFLQGMK